MSTSLGLPVSSTSSSTPSPSATQRSGNGGNSSGSFYRNLFYILIGLLCAFGFVSFFSLVRARKRRRAIIKEANRLGVLVPGVPGYIPLRERRGLGWMKADGTQHPDWWEVKKNGDDEGGHDTAAEEKLSEGAGTVAVREVYNEGDAAYGEASGSGGGSGDDNRGVSGQDEFHPLALIPPRPQAPTLPPIPISDLKFFPNHLAYRAESLIPPKSEFVNASDPTVLDGLVGGKLDLVAVIRMPQPPDPSTSYSSSSDALNNANTNADFSASYPNPSSQNDRNKQKQQSKVIPEGEEVIVEWGGVELGIAEIQIVQFTSDLNSNSNPIGSGWRY